jgi:hypothetical protein
VQLLKDVAKYVRSKNAGPFWVTIDIFCEDDASFRQVEAAESLRAGAIGALYGVPPEQVRVFPDPRLRVLKISFPRPVIQGARQDADSHAGQYFVPLLQVSIAPAPSNYSRRRPSAAPS